MLKLIVFTAILTLISSLRFTVKLTLTFKLILVHFHTYTLIQVHTQVHTHIHTHSYSHIYLDPVLKLVIIREPRVMCHIFSGTTIVKLKDEDGAKARK